MKKEILFLLIGIAAGLIVGGIGGFVAKANKQVSNKTEVTSESLPTTSPGYKNVLGIGELPSNWSVIIDHGSLTSTEPGSFRAQPDYICTVGECGDTESINIKPLKGSDAQKRIEESRAAIVDQKARLTGTEFEYSIWTEDSVSIDGGRLTVFTDNGDKFVYKTALIRWQGGVGGYSFISDRGLEITCHVSESCDHFMKTLSLKNLDEAIDYAYGWW